MTPNVPAQIELDEIRDRVVDALIQLSGIEFGDYNTKLDVDFQSSCQLEAAFASINELLTAFGTEEEQSSAFRRELEDKLAVIEKQRMAIRELATPIIELWDGVLCLPTVGFVDTARSVEMMEALLRTVVKKKTKFAIVDVTGIEVMDTRTVDHFIRMSRAVRLLGAECALTGINPHIAQTIVHMDLNLSDIATHRTLREALVDYVNRRG